MRFIIMHKNDPRTEAGQPPPKELIEKMGAFIGAHAQAGRFLDGAGLSGSKTRTRLRFTKGSVQVQHGPYCGERELPSAMLLLKVSTRDEAMRWAERYGKVLGDAEIELGKINEPWDLGLMPAPENPPLQLLLIEKADASTESGGRTPQQKAQLTRLKAEMAEAGVLAKEYQLEPSTRAKRLVFEKHHARTIDGPFAESKELIGGFSVMELANIDEAVELCRPYAEILGGTLEIDVRALSDV